MKSIQIKTWKLPPIIKIYEAFGALADHRLTLISPSTAQVQSSSGQKKYTVTYNSKLNAIMSNDNGSYWQDYLGYPAITYLLHQQLIAHQPTTTDYLANIKWKDLNTQFNNNWDKTIEFIHQQLISQQCNLKLLLNEINFIYDYLKNHPFNQLGPKTKPPSGY